MSTQHQPPDELDVQADTLLEGGGELGALMRATDWSATSLGPVESWPQALKTTIRIVLTSRQPMFVWWGDDLINLYNDAYRSILVGKHPLALGRPAPVVWHEIWDQVGPRAAAALSGKEGTFDESLLLVMERSGYPEETYFTFSYSPVPNDEGGAGGIFCANTDDTQRIIGERQLALLGELAAATADARTLEDAGRISARVLETNGRDLPFALIYLLTPDHTDLVCVGSAGLKVGHAAAPERMALDAAGPWPVPEALRTNAAVEVGELSIIAGLPTGAWDVPPARAVVIPITPSGEAGRAGALVVGLNPYRLFDESYRSFLGLVAGQIGAAIANAQALEAERRRAEALAELDRAKTTFFSNVSHEFRTPLTLMLAPLEDALRRPVLPDAAREELTVAHRNGLRLLKLVNTLLDFSRIEAGRAEASFEPTDLVAVTADLASTFRSAIERAGLAFEIDMPPLSRPVYVDRDMWEKIVLNLLSNAFKFTLTGSIGVALRRVEDDVELQVADTGTGIPAEELPHLFERFHRVKGARGRSQEGSGIGLALVRELVALHGGSISVQSEPEVGTTFTVRIPAARRLGGSAAGRLGGSAARQPAPSGARGLDSTALGAAPYVEEASRWVATDPSATDSEPPSRPAAEPPSRRAARILLADDNRDMREYVARLLSTHWEVTAVADGQAALESALADPPDLVLADVMMPRLDGFGLLRALRDEQRTKALPVVLLSARAGEEASVEGLEAGADDYVTKPFTARELVARIGAHLAMAQTRRESLAHERDEMERIFTLSPTILATLRGPRHVFEFVNPAYMQLIGHRDVLGKPARVAMPEIEGQGFFEILDEVYLTGQPFVGKELPAQLQRVPGAALEERRLNFVYQPMRDPQGEIVGILASGTDVTELVESRQEAIERARAEAALRETEARYRRLFESIDEGFCVVEVLFDGDGAPRDYRFVEVNRTFEKQTGLHGALGKTAREMVPDLESSWFEIYGRVALTGEAVRFENGSDAMGRWFDVYAFRPGEEESRQVGILFTDITERKRTEQRLRLADRMQAVGTLAGGVAHEVNNQMTAVLGFGAFALSALGPDHPQASDLRLVLQAGERAARITQQLLAFSRRQMAQPRVVDLHALTMDLQPFLTRLVGSDKSLVIAPSRGEGRARVDPAQVEQVLINLVGNSGDATETGDEVSIEIENMEIKGRMSDAAGGEAMPPGRYVALTVSDTGHGMEPETVARIFEPFFTTKPVGRGTGLGLSMVYGIVKQHGGGIVVESAPGRGTAMRLYWPAAEEAEAAGTESAAEAPTSQQVARGRTVLLVEDEPMVRQLALRALEGVGFRVVAAENGAVALRLLADGSVRPDVVLTDIVMPDMNGRQLSEAIAALYGQLPTLFMSGYTGDDLSARRLLPSEAPFLQKPFTPEQLIENVMALVG